MKIIKKIILIYLKLPFLPNNNKINYKDLNFKQIDFTNYKQVKSFIFKENFYKLKNDYVINFDFLNFSKNLGGKIGINLSRKNIILWFKINKNKINYPWNKDFASKRLINILYNYEFITSSSSVTEKKILNKIVLFHINRVLFEFNNKKFTNITSYDLKAAILASFLVNKFNKKFLFLIDYILDNQIDKFGMHKSYNLLEHAKFINNLTEIKNIFLYFDYEIPKNLNSSVLVMSSILNQYFHLNGSLPLFNGTNNNYTEKIYNSINKDEYLKLRSFLDNNNGIAFYIDTKKRIFFDVVQPNKDEVSSTLSSGTLSFELSADAEKIITNCGASESMGKNPEFLRYSAAHSTLILQNTNISEIKEKNPYIKFPQKVSFNREDSENFTTLQGSHNGYVKKFSKIIKRKLKINKNDFILEGEDSVISLKTLSNKIVYHIRFHLMPGITYNLTNNKKNIILKTPLNNMWLFKSESQLHIEDSIYVDKNKTHQIKQIVIKGLAIKNKEVEKWSIQKI